MDGQALLELYDTPGLEDAIALLDQLRDRGNEVSSTLDTIGARIASDISARTHEAEGLLGMTDPASLSAAMGFDPYASYSWSVLTATSITGHSIRS